jgi:hypothetical protein
MVNTVVPRKWRHPSGWQHCFNTSFTPPGNQRFSTFAAVGLVLAFVKRRLANVRFETGRRGILAGWGFDDYETVR